MSFLKKLGSLVLKATELVVGYGPTVRQLMPPQGDAVVQTVEDKLLLATKIVMDAEVMGQAIGAPGTQKAAMAAPAIFQLLLDLPVLNGKKPKDPVQAKAAATALGGALADFLNCFED
jgi:hypothetical protein